MADEDDAQNPYELIGVSTDATDADIRKAYRQRSLKVHPDRVSAGSRYTVFCGTHEFVESQ